mmetsp:Transcript_32929/g.74691  ORF Transcript_32929/g.74691 Transcript_32929/m.74691 type:complete len:135 (-) Transcript_32929:40-444(-)
MTAVELNKLITASRSLKDVLAVCDARLHEFDGVNLATALCRIAKSRGAVKAAGNPAFDALLQAVHEAAARHAFGPRGISNTVWAWARISLPHVEPLFASISSAAERSMQDFSEQDLSNIVWSFSRLAVSDTPLL